MNDFAVYDGIKTAQTDAIMAKANHNDLKSVQNYVKKNYVAPNPEYYGVAKGKNVLVIHLESFQQFLIDYKYKGKEVTPNLNKLYHENDTISFDNFFNQVGQVIVIIGPLHLVTLVKQCRIENEFDTLPDKPSYMTVSKLGRITFRLAGDGFDTKLVDFAIGVRRKYHTVSQLCEKSMPEGIILIHI